MVHLGHSKDGNKVELSELLLYGTFCVLMEMKLKNFGYKIMILHRTISTYCGERPFNT